ncbi:S53 family peptidase [Ideonella sp. B508-1]|uniref:S53 family peptidase n=1 Tax=Ideonella sp. B508-1 TaxID=137716 RepID=UPI00034CA8BF|nr:S53 family peptidase [Ideonella sp. B508-1]
MHRPRRRHPVVLALSSPAMRGTAAGLALCLSACGGGSDAPAPVPGELASASLTFDAVVPDGAPLPSAVQATPAFHVAPVVLDAPSDLDAAQPDASAGLAPHASTVPQALAGLPSRRLTPQALQAALAAGSDGATRRMQAAAATEGATPSGMQPLAAGSTVVTYTPAQIRAAYQLPALPAAGTTLSAAQAAQLGAGQTVYIVDAYHDPSVVAELAAFNSKFGLPACTTTAIAATASLPLAAAAKTGCSFSVVYANSAGKMSTTAPAYDAGWATEITLDVQWAHATAPLARIVLIEAPDASLNSLLAAVQLANAMGPGVVSMSFGAGEGSWVGSVDGAFAGTGMSYAAATGDNGAGVEWPSVSARVLGVGGTSLAYSGAARGEAVWSGTGGGVSAYVATPSYQNSSVPGMGVPVRRGVADVAFNADPATGQYVATIAPGSSTVGWVSAGGTSLATPQWAGLLAVANALRAQTGLASLTTPQTALYGGIASKSTSYAASFLDVTSGSHGSCSVCSAKAGFDLPSGLGTPQASALLSALSSASVLATPPVVTPATVNGQVGVALSFSVSVTAANPVSYSLSGAPAGMAVSTAGVVSWAAPVAGSYQVTATAKDSKTGLSGQGVYTVVIAAPVAPTVSTATVNGTAGQALQYTVGVSAANAVSYSLAGAPAGVAISTSGVLSWAKPVVGSYKITVSAKDSKTGLSGSGVITLVIQAAATTPAGPVISAPALTGKAGQPLSGTITITDPGVSWLQVTIGGAPLGMGFSLSGTSVNLSWPKPVAGSYTLTLKVIDSAGRSATATQSIVIR